MNGTETQSLAYSTDGGATWQQYEGNPVIDAPPEGWNITGWRDPFFEPWPEMDELLGNTEPHYYAVFGSGIKGVGPRIPFYSAPASDLTSWTLLGAVWEPQANTTLGPILQTGTYGFNFEVSGFFSLYDEDGIVHYFVNVSPPHLHRALDVDENARIRANQRCRWVPKVATSASTPATTGHCGTRVS